MRLQKSKRIAELEEALAMCRIAFQRTREYVEPAVTLYATPGWSWFDATQRIDALIGPLPPSRPVSLPDDYSASVNKGAE